MSKLQPNKENLPFLISDLVLDGAELLKMAPRDAQTPEFRLVLKDPSETIADMRELIYAVYP